MTRSITTRVLTAPTDHPWQRLCYLKPRSVLAQPSVIIDSACDAWRSLIRGVSAHPFNSAAFVHGIELLLSFELLDGCRAPRFPGLHIFQSSFDDGHGLFRG